MTIYNNCSLFCQRKLYVLHIHYTSILFLINIIYLFPIQDLFNRIKSWTDGDFNQHIHLRYALLQMVMGYRVWWSQWLYEDGMSSNPWLQITFLFRIQKPSCRAEITWENEPSSSVAQSEWLTTGFKNGYPLPQLILSKATRKEAYYQAKHHVKKKDALLNEFIYIQVLWLGHPECSATWEPASNLPHSLIRDYEAGIESEVSLEKASMYGYISNVLHVSRKQSQGSISEPKKWKNGSIADRWSCRIQHFLNYNYYYVYFPFKILTSQIV